jgi:metal-dependent amidase/aminoacylase/carboxypeptidase family protein
MRGGFTGAVASRSCGSGPVIALRFDIDALDLIESDAASHRPARDGFASMNRGAAHACGHDGHVAIGLGVAFWGDQPGPKLWIGGAMVLGGVLAIALRSWQKSRQTVASA